MWGKKVPKQYFDSYATELGSDGAVQSFKDYKFLAKILEEFDSINFSIPNLSIGLGEPPKFLGAITKVVNPNLIVDIGTSCGGSSRTFLEYSSSSATIKTFDILKWDSFPETWLKDTYFSSGKLTQFLEDLGNEFYFRKHSQLFKDADLIYLDAPKDGKFEYNFMRLLSQVSFPKKQRYLIMDDIRFLNMAALWRDINSPKIDITSLGHWSGTGLVDISEGLLLA